MNGKERTDKNYEQHRNEYCESCDCCCNEQQPDDCEHCKCECCEIERKSNENTKQTNHNCLCCNVDTLNCDYCVFAIECKEERLQSQADDDYDLLVSQNLLD